MKTPSLSALSTLATERTARHRIRQLERAVASRRLVGDHEAVAVLARWLADERAA